MSFHSSGRNVVKPLGERLAEALRQSVGLGAGGMAPKQLAHDLGVDVKTVYGWMAGQGIRGEHLIALFDRMPEVFGNIVLGGTRCMLIKPSERAARKRALRIALQAIEDDDALVAVELKQREQDERHGLAQAHAGGLRQLATEGSDGARRNEAGALLADGAGQADGVVKP